jgi:hypothetical protein
MAVASRSEDAKGAWSAHVQAPKSLTTLDFPSCNRRLPAEGAFLTAKDIGGLENPA